MTVGLTGTIDAKPLARARPVSGYDEDGNEEYGVEWRPEPVPYEVPDWLRIPKWDDIGESSGHLTLTEALVRRIEALIITGSSREAAKSVCGVNPRLWRDWKARAKAEKTPYYEAFQRFDMARQHVEVSASRMVTAVSQVDDPRTALAGAKMRLEHTNPARYAPKAAAPTGPTYNGAVHIQQVSVFAHLSAEDVGKLLAARTEPAPRRLVTAANLAEIVGGLTTAPMGEEEEGP